MRLIDKGVIKRVVVTPDKHFPLHDSKAINVLCKTIEIVKPDAYVDLGDVGEWEGFSAWKYKRKKAPPLEFLIKDFNKDIKDVNKGMDIIDESLDKANCSKGCRWKGQRSQSNAPPPPPKRNPSDLNITQVVI